MTKSVKNGRPAIKPPVDQVQPQPRTFQEDELIPDSEIEMARLRARNATLEAEFIAMRNDLIRVKQELQRRIDGEGEKGSTNGKNKVGSAGKNGGRSKTKKS